MNTKFHTKCRALLDAYRNGKLGQTRMPEDSNPGFSATQNEQRLAYFSLPMALNYQRDSYKLWEAALKTFQDKETAFVFDVNKVTAVSEEEVRKALMKYKLALQPNKHIQTWRAISRTISENWGSFDAFFQKMEKDFLKLKQALTLDHKKDSHICLAQKFSITGPLS